MIAQPAGAFTDMVGAYLIEKTGMELTPGEYSAMMVVTDDKDFAAGVVFTNFRKTDIELSAASETLTAWRPEVLRTVFKYVFEQLGCARCTSITVKGNRKARSFLEGLGFQLEGNIRLGYDGRRDALIYGLLRSECRYLVDDSEGIDGQEKRPEGSASAGPGSDGERPSGDERQVSDGAGEPKPD